MEEEKLLPPPQNYLKESSLVSEKEWMWLDHILQS